MCKNLTRVLFEYVQTPKYYLSTLRILQTAARFFDMRKLTCCCYCCLHIKNRSDLYSVPSNIRIGPTDANAFRGHRLTTQKGTYFEKSKRNQRAQKSQHTRDNREKKQKNKAPDSQTSQATCQTKEI